MSKIKKIGMYTTDEILKHLTEGEGRGFLGRSMYDAIMEKIKQQESQLQQKENVIKGVREYLTSYESIDTIQGLEDIEKNKDLDEKTLNEMIRRYMIVHDKLLEILDKEVMLNDRTFKIS